MPIGPLEILIVFVVFLARGPSRIANLFRSLGTGIHDFVETLGRSKEKEELPGKEQDDEQER